MKTGNLSEREERATRNGKVSSRKLLTDLDSDRYMTKKEAAAYTGLSARTLDSARDLRRYKPGGKILFKNLKLMPGSLKAEFSESI